MGLTIRKDSKWWYARYYIDGRQIVKRLNVEVKGERPSKLSEAGNRAFENSRIRAEESFDALQAKLDTNKSEEELAQAVYQARAGTKLKRHKLDDIPKIWIDKPRKRAPSLQHHDQSIAKLKKLVFFLRTNYPKIGRVDQIRYEHIKAFLDELEQSGVTAETWNKYLVPIKTVLKRAGVPAAKDLIARDVETVFRKPYTIEELNAIFTAAQSDPLLYPLVITAACTAMRRKDCCFLQWESIDMEAGFITVKTSKTGVEVDIPMADMLRAEIEKRQDNGSDYVFPEAKLLYEADPTAITRRFKTVLRLAGFDDGKASPAEFKSDPYTVEELREKAEELYNGKRLGHALKVIEAYASGQSMKKSAETAGVVMSNASLYLNDLESATGRKIIRGKRRVIKAVAPPTRGNVREERKNGKLKASVRDFHSFRTTFVTLALMRGMPIDTVKKITGHQTAEIVTKHYFRPEREQLKAAIQNTMPGLLTSSAKPFTPAERAVEVLRAVDSKMNKADVCKLVDEALKILEGAVQ